MSTIITPTIGRRVWYWPSDLDRGTYLQSRIQQSDSTQACDGGIVYVHSDRMVNLSVADHNGVMHARCSVRLLQGDEVAAAGEAHATWMPHQKAQTAPPVDYRDRVRAEAAELFTKALALGAFIVSDVAARLPEAELSRLSEQYAHMQNYHRVLVARIAAFPVETKVYPDGTVATGVAPLSEKSPTERQGQLLTEDPDHAFD